MSAETWMLKEWYTLHEKGLCGRCRMKLNGHTKWLCKDCLTHKAQVKAERDAQRIEDGICINCGKTPALIGKTKCNSCTEKSREYQRRYYLNKK